MLKFVHEGTQDQEEDTDHQPSTSKSVAQDKPHATNRSKDSGTVPSPDQQPSTSSSGIHDKVL